MSRTTRIDLAPLLGALADSSDDPTTERILDATLASLVAGGLRRCTVEEVAERANVGRSTIYRRFDGRNELIHAVVARELRRILTAVTESVDHLDSVTDKLVDGFLAGLDAAEGSDFLHFLRSEPELMILLVDDSYSAIEMVTGIMVEQLLKATDADGVDVERARHVAEVVFRLAVSFAVIPGSTLPLKDRVAGRDALHAIFDRLAESAT